MTRDGSAEILKISTKIMNKYSRKKLAKKRVKRDEHKIDEEKDEEKENLGAKSKKDHSSLTLISFKINLKIKSVHLRS